MSWLVVIKEIIALLAPLAENVIAALRDKDVRALGLELKSAVTPEEKKDVAKKIADALFR